jgi:hypothetical protein
LIYLVKFGVELKRSGLVDNTVVSKKEVLAEAYTLDYIADASGGGQCIFTRGKGRYRHTGCHLARQGATAELIIYKHKSIAELSFLGQSRTTKIHNI